MKADKKEDGLPHYDFLRSEFRSAGSVDDLIVIRCSLGFVFEQLAEVSEEPLPVTRHILHTEMIQNKVLAPKEVQNHKYNY